MTERKKSEEINLFVAELARQHGIACTKTANDALADVVTELAGDKVVTDATEDLIVALRRAHVIDGPTMVDLLGRYLTVKMQAKAI